MKLFFLLSLLVLSLVHEGTSTRLETHECHKIREVINATVQQAAVDLESSLASTMERLFKPIQAQLDSTTSFYLH